MGERKREPSKEFLKGYSVRVATLSGLGGVQYGQCSDLLPDHVAIEALRCTLEIGTNASDEVYATVSTACQEALQNFETGGSKRRRAGSHLASLRILSLRGGVVSLARNGKWKSVSLITGRLHFRLL